ncbi:MAG: TolC family protein [bacterium]
MLKNIFISILMIGSTIFSQEQKLTLSKCIQLSLEKSFQTNIEKSKLRSQKAKILEINTYLLPDIKLYAGYSRLSKVSPFQVDLPGITNGPVTISKSIFNNYNAQLSLNQLIFAGFRIQKQIEIVNEEYNRQNIQIEAKMNDEALEVTYQFYDSYKLKKEIDYLKLKLESVDEHLQIITNLFKNGKVLKNEILKYEIHKAKIELKLIITTNQYELNMVKLLNKIGVDNTLNYSLEYSFQEEIEPVEISDEMIIHSIETRSEIKITKINEQIIQSTSDLAKSDYYPTISFNGNYYYSKPNQRIMPTIDQFKNTWAINLNLSWELWNWGRSNYAVQQIEESHYQNQQQLNQLKEDIGINVKDCLNKYENDKKTLVIKKKTKDLANENYRIIKELYQNQQATNADLVDAETEQIELELNYLTGEIDIRISQVSLEKALGKKIY